MERLTSKLNTKLAESNFYEAHQLYRTIYFRLNRDVNYSCLAETTSSSTTTRREPGSDPAIEQKVRLIKEFPNYEVILEFLSQGAERLLSFGEIISGLDLIQTFVKQLDYIVCPTTCKPTANETNIFYYKFLKKWFLVLMSLFQIYVETGYGLIHSKKGQSLLESDFISDRDNLMEKIMQISNHVREVEIGTDSERKIMNASIREHGYSPMHLMNGKLLVKNKELKKARNCMVFADSSFELAKFLYFFCKIEHNRTEFESILIKQLLRVFNSKLFLGAKPGIYRNKPDEKMKKLVLEEFSENEIKKMKKDTFIFVKEVFLYYLIITKFFLVVRDGKVEVVNGHFRQFRFLKFFHLFLIILEECLLEDHIISPESIDEYEAEFNRNLASSFKFNNAKFFDADEEIQSFFHFFSNRDFAEVDFGPRDSSSERKAYRLNLYYKLRTFFYKDTLDFHRKVDPDLDTDLIDRVFFVYFNSPDKSRDWDKVDPEVEYFFGANEPRRPAGQQGGGNFIFNLLSGAGIPGLSQAGGPGNLSDLFNDILR